MGLRTLVPILALLAPSSAVPDEDSHQPVGSALVGDDECSAGAGGCGLHALQRRSDLLSEEAEGKPALEDEKFPLHVANGAGNDVVLANCHEAYHIRSDEEIGLSMPAGGSGGFWVLTTGKDFNCTHGCEECFYVAMDWTATEGASVRIGFGLEAKGKVAQPQGGGIALSVKGAGSKRCTDKSCKEGWTSALPVDLDASVVSIVVHGSESSKPMGNDTMAASGDLEVGRGGRGFRGGGFGRGFRRGGIRPGFRRPFRPGFRRPIYRPLRPGWGFGHYPTCFYCHQYGLTTCWWLCR